MFAFVPRPSRCSMFFPSLVMTTLWLVTWRHMRAFSLDGSQPIASFVEVSWGASCFPLAHPARESLEGWMMEGGEWGVRTSRLRTNVAASILRSLLCFNQIKVRSGTMLAFSLHDVIYTIFILERSSSQATHLILKAVKYLNYKQVDLDEIATKFKAVSETSWSDRDNCEA
jgi:hypothetical protein